MENNDKLKKSQCRSIGMQQFVTLMAFSLSLSWSRLLKQFTQLQLLQNSPLAKQSQYLWDKRH